MTAFAFLSKLFLNNILLAMPHGRFPEARGFQTLPYGDI
jgi:hypothetical protein